MSCVRFFISLLIATILVTGSQTYAETTAAPDTNEVTAPFPQNGSTLEQCMWTCNRIAGNYRGAKIFEANCKKSIAEEQGLSTLYGQAQNVAKIVDMALLKCLPQAGVKAVVGIPEFVMALPAMTYQAVSALFSNAESAEAYKKAEACYANMDCRKGMMRQLIMFREQNPDGSFKVPDDKMVAQLADVNFETLWTQSKFQYESSRDECMRYMWDVKLETQAGANITPQMNRTIYDRVAKERTYCLSVLQLMPPELDPRLGGNPEIPKNTGTDTASLIDRLTLGQKMAVGKACLGEQYDDIIVGMCSDVVSVVVPIPVPGSKARVLGKTDEVVGPVNTPKPGAIQNATEVTSVAAAATKSAFVNAYKGLVFATRAENLKFMAIATKANAGLLNAARTRFLAVENTAMKFLNSAVPKEFVTALTNFHKQKLDDGLEAVKAKYQKLYPGLELDVYSDFKSIQVAIQSPVNITPAMHKAIYDDLNAAFKSANDALVAKMAESGLDVAALKDKAIAAGMDPKVAADPNMWFRGAFGSTPDETNIAARMSRNNTGTNNLVDFSSPAVQQHAEEVLTSIEAQRVAISQNTNLAQLLTKTEHGFSIPRAEVFDMARKSTSAQDLANAINLRYGMVKGFKPVTVADAEKLRGYVKEVNEFNPAIFIADREVLSLDNATQGAASADFLGLGSENYYATAAGLAGRKNIKDALGAVRTQEGLVTQNFVQRQARFKEIVGGNVKCSGDDCLKVLDTPLNSTQKAQLMDQLATDPSARRVRVSFIGANVAQEHRILLATHGEEIEKALRSGLEGKIPYEKLSQITFGLDMTSSQIDQGFVNLMIGKGRTVHLSAREQEIIMESFGSAIGKYNHTYANYIPGQVSANVTGVRFIVGPNLIINQVNQQNQGEE